MGITASHAILRKTSLMTDSKYFYRPYNGEFRRAITIYSDKVYTLEELFPELIQRKTEQETEERIIDFIREREEYQGLEEEDFSVNFVDGIYEVLVLTGEEGDSVLIQLELDENDNITIAPLDTEKTS